MTIHTQQYQNSLNKIKEMTDNLQKEIGSLNRNIGVFDKYIEDVSKVNVPLDDFKESKVNKINEDLNHILFLQDMIKGDLDSLNVVVTSLMDRGYFFKNSTKWVSEISRHC